MTLSVETFIQNTINQYPIVIFMKGTPESPRCGFSGQVVRIFQICGAPFVGINVLEPGPEGLDVREGIKAFTQWPTIPQIFIKGEFIGGCDILREMYQAGELQTLLAEKELITPEHQQAKG
jgi:monothiol glutaredoxin